MTRPTVLASAKPQTETLDALRAAGHAPAPDFAPTAAWRSRSRNAASVYRSTSQTPAT